MNNCKPEGKSTELIKVYYNTDSVESFIAAMILFISHRSKDSSKDCSNCYVNDCIPLKCYVHGICDAYELLDVNMDSPYIKNNQYNKQSIARVIWKYHDHGELDEVSRKIDYNGLWKLNYVQFPDITKPDNVNVELKTEARRTPLMSSPYFLWMNRHHKMFNPAIPYVPALIRMIDLYYREHCCLDGEMPFSYEQAYELFEVVSRHNRPFSQPIIDLLEYDNIADLKAALKEFNI